MTLKIRIPLKDSNLLDISGGSAGNMVPGNACALIKNVKAEDVKRYIEQDKARGITAVSEGENLRLSAAGVGGHVGFPQGTVNAIHKLCSFMDRYALIGGDGKNAVNFLANVLEDPYGSGFGVAYEDEVSGKLSCVGTVIKLCGSEICLDVNIRYSVTARAEDILASLRSCCGRYGASVTDVKDSAPCYLEPDRREIQALNDICNEILHKQYKPFVMGGGTYARKLPNAVGYGCGIPNTPGPFGKGKGDGHQSDECVKIQDLVNAVKIYSRAILALDEIVE